MYFVYFILVVLLWGSNFILMKKGLLAFGPAGVGAYRLLSGAAALIVIWLAQRQPWPMKRRDFLPMLLVAIIGYSVPFVVQPLVIKHTSSGFMGIFMSLTPLLIVIVSIPMLGVWPTRRQVLGVVGGLMFLALLFWDALARAFSPLDVALGVSVPAGYSVMYTFVKRRFPDVSALALTCASLALGGALLLPVTLAGERIETGPNFNQALAAVLVLGVLGTAVSNYMFFKLVQDRGPLFAGMVAYLIPFVALAIGWFDGEPLSVRQIVALLGILVMVAVVQWRPGAAPPRGPEMPTE